MKVAEIMTRDVQTVSPEMDLLSVAKYMKDLDVGVIPVVDNGNLVGVITDRDIVVRVVALGRDPIVVSVGDNMTPNPTTISPDDDVQQAAQIMAREQIRRLPVVEGSTLVGIVALGDVAVDSGEEKLSGRTLEDISMPSEPRDADREG